MPQSWDMGHIILLPLRRKAYRGFSGCPKNPTDSAGFEPANGIILSYMLRELIVTWFELEVFQPEMFVK
jgi:hypothetical protein